MTAQKFIIGHFSFVIGKTDTAKPPRTAEFAKKTNDSAEIYHWSFIIFHWKTDTAKPPRTAEFAKKTNDSAEIYHWSFIIFHLSLEN